MRISVLTVLLQLVLWAFMASLPMAAGAQAPESFLVYVWRFSARDPSQQPSLDEISAEMTEEFEESLIHQRCCVVLERRRFDRLIAHVDNERWISEIASISPTTLDSLRSHQGNAVVFGELHDDIASAELKISVTLETFDSQIWSKRSRRCRRGLPDSPALFAGAMRELAHDVCADIIESQAVESVVIELLLQTPQAYVQDLSRLADNLVLNHKILEVEEVTIREKSMTYRVFYRDLPVSQVRELLMAKLHSQGYEALVAEVAGETIRLSIARQTLPTWPTYLFRTVFALSAVTSAYGYWQADRSFSKANDASTREEFDNRVDDVDRFRGIAKWSAVVAAFSVACDVGYTVYKSRYSQRSTDERRWTLAPGMSSEGSVSIRFVHRF